MEKKLIIVPVIAMEMKTVDKEGDWKGKKYILITYRVGSMFAPKIKRTTVMIDNDPATAAAQLAFFEPMIASGVFPNLKGSYFTIGDKTIDPNTITLPVFQYVLSDGSLSTPKSSIRVFLLYDDATGEYEKTPQEQALSIIYNTDLCRVIVEDEGVSAHEVPEGASPFGTPTAP